jgi:hypothetical protein
MIHLMMKKLQHKRIIEPTIGGTFGYAEKIFFPPLSRALGVNEQPGRIHGFKTHGIVHLFLACTPIRTLK